MRLGGLGGEDDVGAVAPQPARDGQADAAAGPGNEDRPVPECHVAPESFSCRESVVHIGVKVNLRRLPPSGSP
jgi:hypothetical protein